VKYAIERSYYRIQYPLAERPTLLADGHAFPVLDCSEHGLRYIRKLPQPLEVGDIVRGVLTFRRGPQTVVEGEVVRIQGDQVALHLNITPIPMGMILTEQRYLRMHYAMRF
jgi:hypothetical protein